jgi:hypothetical protein
MRMLTLLINIFFPRVKQARIRTYVVFCAVLCAFGRPAVALVSEQELSEKFQFYRSIERLSVAFQQTKHLKDMNLDLRSSGQLALDHGVVTWEVQKPSPVTVKISASDVEITGPSGQQSFKLKDLSKDSVARGVGLLLPWLTFDAKALSTQYKISRLAAQRYAFEPIAADFPVRKIVAELTKEGHIERLVMSEASGDTLEIKFASPKVTRKAP